MRRIIIALIIAFLFSGCTGSDTNAPKSRTEQELLASYLDLHQRKDLAGSLALFYQQGTPSFVIDMVKKRIQQNFAFPIASAQIEEIPPDKLAAALNGFPVNGKTLVPNLKPLKQITFTYQQNDKARAAGGSIMYGKIDNVCYFVLSKES